MNVPKFGLVKLRTLIRDCRGSTQPANDVLNTQEELDEYVASTQDKHEPKHTVAFPEERAVAVALSSRPHGGSKVEIIAVAQETGRFVGVQHHVLYVEHVPHGLATDMMTFPEHMIRLRGLSGVVSFRQVPDWIGRSLHARTGALTSTGRPPPTAQATGTAGLVTSFYVGEEGPPATPHATVEEIHLASLCVGEEHLPTAHGGEHLAISSPTLMAKQQENKATAPSHSVDLPIDGQGTISVEVAHFDPPPERYAIALADVDGGEVFRIVVRDWSVSIELIEDGLPVGPRPAVAAVATTTPFISFPASSMVIWVSVDRCNRRVSFGQGYMMRRNEVVSLQLPVQPGIADLALTNRPISRSRVRDVHRVVFDDVIAFYQARTPHANLMPVVLDPPPVVVERDKITLEDLARNDHMPASLLPNEAQVLWGTVSGTGIAVSQSDADAINYSLNTKGKTLYEIVQRKRAEVEFGDPNMVYVRATIGPPRGDSPGVPFVIEIWPKNSYSPVHNHGNTVAIIKVLHGSISVSWYGPLADKDNPEPCCFDEQTLCAGDVTWMTPEMYQTHQLKNPRSDTACITIQSYRYLNGDDVHHEYFDYLAPGEGVRRFFEPNSDIEYLDLIQRVRQEYGEGAYWERQRRA